MSHLPEENPDTLEYPKSGGFSFQMSEDNPFRRIPVNQTCEETVYKDSFLTRLIDRRKLSTRTPKHQEEPKVSV